MTIRYSILLKVINDNSTKGQDDGQDNSSKIFYTDYQWQKNIEKWNLRITNGTTNEMVIANSDLFNGNSKRKNHSLYTQIDKKWNRLNLSFGARFEHFSLTSIETHVRSNWTASTRGTDVAKCNAPAYYIFVSTQRP